MSQDVKQVFKNYTKNKNNNKSPKNNKTSPVMTCYTIKKLDILILMKKSNDFYKFLK